MTTQSQYKGIFTAVPTPFDGNGRFVGEPLKRQIKHLLEAGVHGIVPLGGTGEYTAIAADERRKVVAAAIEAVNGKVPVIPGIISPGIGDALDNARAFTAEGAKALMVVTPYYYRPTQQGILDYYKRFSDEIDADIVLYDIPYRTGVPLTVETIASLAEMTRVVGIKACSPDLSQQVRVVQAAGKNMSILSGEEDVFPLHVAMGAVGGIVGTSTVIPKHWLHLLSLGLQGKLAEATAFHAANMRPLIDALFSEPNPAPIKAALAIMGNDFGDVLTPLQPASMELREKLRKMLAQYQSREAEL
ncbi:4-hydroxy-tetrahydrodipicolinate synthase [Trinickia dinghuensis]|uniref:4-hydroxy-tetrahydrodipicolinate synthase n=1 Tax=Trinickia dinghuensis TaxID=2291023 RepID=A0A3D8JUZ5_9BURK|nr:4-hydroxy-tetrahydrodipicolinate synthase [Trinickia dinghuensis]RDU96221.1 4-hydroxy-tetrahydrodipicolinate synthase [Trinickia dinghuensis]